MAAGGIVQGDPIALGSGLLLLRADGIRHCKVRQCAVHRGFLSCFGVTVGQHAVMQWQVRGNAGHIVVLMPRRTGQHPGQVHRVEKGHRAGRSARGPERILQGIQQLSGSFRGIPLGLRYQAGKVTALFSAGDVIPYTATGKGHRPALFFPDKSMLIGKYGWLNSSRSTSASGRGAYPCPVAFFCHRSSSAA